MTETRASTRPFSLRLSPEVRARLEKEAAGIPLGPYILSKALNEPPPVRLRRSGLPIKDRRSLARLLALLGRSRLANNINQLAYAANTGSLPLDEETIADLQYAISTIQEMRGLLVMALGLTVEASP